MLTVLGPGPLATVQDQGRFGYAHLGVPRSGAADRASLRLANRVVGNPEAAAGVEVTFGGLRVRADAALLVAVTGAAGPVSVDGRPAPHGEPIWLAAGATLELGRPVVGLRTYVGIAGGVDAPAVLGSRSTDTLSDLGPERLRTGSRLLVGEPAGVPATADIPAMPAPDARLRVVPGPRDDWFDAEALDQLLSASWRVGDRTDRVGARLEGPKLGRSRRHELPSEGCVRGALQVSADGVPALFGPDHPVTGGYPVLAVVVDAECDAGGQLRPGDAVRFERMP